MNMCRNRQTSISKIEELFEAETLSEKDCFDEGSDITIQMPALRRLRKSMKRKRASVTVSACAALSCTYYRHFMFVTYVCLYRHFMFVTLSFVNSWIYQTQL